MKIALVTDWFAPRRGGIESQLLGLASGLGERGHEVDVLTSTPGAASGDGFSVRAVPTLYLPRSHVAMSPTIVGALREMLRRDYDVVHAHVSVVSPVGYTAAAVARALGLPTVVTFHSVLRHKRYLLGLVDSIAGLSTSAVVWTAVSQLVADQVQSALTGAEVGRLPNGIDLEFWRGAPAVPSGRARGRVNLVSTMRLHAKKRPRRLLVAFAQAAVRARVPVLLRIIGDGPEARTLRRDVQALDLEQGTATVEILGWLPPAAVRAVYAESDAFVLASERESFGIAALEAAAAGLPVIAMGASGCREFLDAESELLCRDDATLAAALARFISAPDRTANVRPSTPLETYDWRSVLGDHEAVYRAAIARSVSAERSASA